MDYQGLRQKVGVSNLQTVPSANLTATCLGQKIGASGIPGCDFSEYNIAALQANNNGRIIYGPTTGQPFPGNVIPTGRLSAPALNLFRALQPYAPNTFTDSTCSGLRNNYAASGSGEFNSDQWDVRVDEQVLQNLHAFARFSRFTDVLTGSTIFGGPAAPALG